MLGGLSGLDGPRLTALLSIGALMMRFVISLFVLSIAVWVIGLDPSAEKTFAGMLVSTIGGYWFGVAERAGSMNAQPQVKVQATATRDGENNVQIGPDTQ